MSKLKVNGSNLLSFDGGGVQGLSSLLILQDLMHLISPDGTLLPYQLFDMICGTSTGGIIAIMLGRLRMSTDGCIRAYHNLSREIFEEPWHPNAWKAAKVIIGANNTKKRSNRLENAICSIIKQYLPAAERERYLNNDGSGIDPYKVPLLAESNDEGENCRVFVATTQQADGKLTLLRTFRSPDQIDLGFTIVEACLATAAAPMIFEPLKKTYGDAIEYYIDGGLGNNNPVRHLLNEHRSTWSSRTVNVLISIGTGNKKPRPTGNSMLSLFKKVSEMAADASEQATDFKRFLKLHDKELYARYFRFSVGSALQDVRLDEWRMLGIICQRTRSWLRKHDSSMLHCSKVLGCLTYKETVSHTDEQSRTPRSDPLAELSVALSSIASDVSDEISIEDPEVNNSLKISFWRTVRLPENGKKYDLPAGFGRFPLLDAKPFKNILEEIGIRDADIIMPMYDREAMYMQFEVCAFDFSNPQRAFAIRPYVGGINAISGKPMLSKQAGVDRTRQSTSNETTQPGEAQDPLHGRKQDYFVADISIHDVSVIPQWLDGIATSNGTVKQFVAVPFGSEESIESQKQGQDLVGGIQLEVVPTYPLCRLRVESDKEINIRIMTLTNESFLIRIGNKALVWDLLRKVADHYGGGNLDFYRLVFRGNPLEPLGRLDYYAIDDEATIYMIQKLRGGGSGPEFPKVMAIGAGGSISQNVKSDKQPPNIWDTSRSKVINIQIVNALVFERLTGIIAPPAPIGFQEYLDLEIPFFHFYTDDEQVVSGEFEDINTIKMINHGGGASKGKKAERWTEMPDVCSNCSQDSPFRLNRPCGHSLCLTCYHMIEVKLVDDKPRSICPTEGCNTPIGRSVAWPQTSDQIQIETFFTRVPIDVRHNRPDIDEFQSVKYIARTI